MLYTYLKADKIDFWEKGWLGGQGVDDLIGGQGKEDEIFLHIFNSFNVKVFLGPNVPVLQVSTLFELVKQGVRTLMCNATCYLPTKCDIKCTYSKYTATAYN